MLKHTFEEGRKSIYYRGKVYLCWGERYTYFVFTTRIMTAYESMTYVRNERFIPLETTSLKRYEKLYDPIREDVQLFEHKYKVDKFYNTTYKDRITHYLRTRCG